MQGNIPVDMERYPLRVHYPYGGRHFMLRWHAYDEGHIIILARSERGIKESFGAVLRAHGGVTVKEYVEIDIIAPRLEYREAYARAMFDRDMSCFWSWVAHSAESYSEKNDGRMHPGLAACTNYVSMYPPEEGEPEAVGDTRHTFCKNCECGIIPKNGTPISEYLRLRDAFEGRVEGAKPYKPKVRYDGEVSRAPDGDPLKECFAARANFGDHCSGIDIGMALSHDRHLFYYHIIQSLDASPFAESAKKKEEEHAKTVKGRNAYYKKQHRREDLERLATLDEFFGKEAK